MSISVMRELIINNIDNSAEPDNSEINAGYSQWRSQIADILKVKNEFALATLGCLVGYNKFNGKSIVDDTAELGGDQIQQVDAIESMINKFDHISAKMQKTAAVSFDTIEGKKYADKTDGARSFRVIQMLPVSYEFDPNQQKTLGD